MAEAQVAVVGGGLAGLFTASELIATGVDDLVVLDDGEAPGGVARTIDRDGFSLEPAAGTLLLPHPHLSPVLERLGAEVEPAVDAGLRYVFTRGRLVALPSSPKAAFAPIAPWRAKLRAAAEPFIRKPPPSEDETLDSFMRRRLGDRMGRLVAWVAASGVFAGDPHRLSARAAFPAITSLEAEAGSIVRGALRRLRSRPRGAPRPTSHVPVGGMTALAETAARRLGTRLQQGRAVDAVRRSGGRWEVSGGDDTIEADHVVLACRPQTAGRLLGGAFEPLLARAVTAPVVVVGLGGLSADLPLPPGFGALAGPDAGTATLGVLFESSYAPRRAPEGSSLAKVIAGGATRPDVVGWDDDRLVEHLSAEVAQILGSEIDPSFVEVVRHEAGIPQYEPGHLDWLERVDEITAEHPGLHLTGWGYRGVGVAHLAADATRVARTIGG
ncbi:MAG: protoporphyrinogen oxidase [Acidimicrobiia bacterium]|nr:protoporphyrinogen oxidase [Acidimicrobiia bacterium]